MTIEDSLLRRLCDCNPNPCLRLYLFVLNWLTLLCFVELKLPIYASENSTLNSPLYCRNVARNSINVPKEANHV